MASGFLFAGRCFAASGDATAAYWAANPVYLTSANPVMTTVTFSGSTWVMNRYNVAANNGTLSLVSSSQAPSLTFPPCDTSSSFNDGVLMGWGVVAAMVAAYGIKVLRRAI